MVDARSGQLITISENLPAVLSGQGASDGMLYATYRCACKAGVQSWPLHSCHCLLVHQLDGCLQESSHICQYRCAASLTFAPGHICKLLGDWLPLILGQQEQLQLQYVLKLSPIEFVINTAACTLFTTGSHLIMCTTRTAPRARCMIRQQSHWCCQHCRCVGNTDVSKHCSKQACCFLQQLLSQSGCPI
jgi:hypothetical protein